jgi:hypothetical protein
MQKINQKIEREERIDNALHERRHTKDQERNNMQVAIMIVRVTK